MWKWSLYLISGQCIVELTELICSLLDDLYEGQSRVSFPRKASPVLRSASTRGLVKKELQGRESREKFTTFGVCFAKCHIMNDSKITK